VLLDAPCTLDASVRHILHHHKLGWREFDPQISQQVTKLQMVALLSIPLVVFAKLKTRMLLRGY